ncbi:HAD family hydrolase [candidate division WOR-3 bacterium]|nr:HAD family hydrolase [candidate division WOR-3 bacterium]
MANPILEGIKGISFDFWYTIGRYESEAEWARQDAFRVEGFSRILSAHGCTIDTEKIARVLQEVGTECEEERLRAETEIASHELVYRFLTRLDIQKQLAAGLSAMIKVFDESLLAVKIIAEPGAKEVLSALKDRGYPLALLSNTSHGHIIRQIMDREGLTPFFDHLIYTDEIGPRKPNPKAFEFLLERLGTEPQETVHIGDRLELDVLGARRSGIRSVLYQSNRDYCYDGYPRPDFCIHRLKELIED